MLTIVVFGASGHLAKTKTFPALYELFRDDVFPDTLNIIGFARSKLDLGAFHERISVKLKGPKIKPFLDTCTYFQGEQYDSEASFVNLKETIEQSEGTKNRPESNRLFYFAIPPTVFASVARLTSQYLFTSTGWNRVIVEKPFGKDLQSSNELVTEIGQYLNEEKLYRIDHYLAKEMVQNILAFRFANTIWGAIWNRKYIKCIKISMKENAGVEGRGGYYDEYGAIRDVFQNHLLQVLTLIAMESPATLSSEDIRDEKVKVLKCINSPPMNDVVVGQYGKSEDGSLPSYREDESVAKINPNSRQVTFCQAVLFIRNERWDGVPFICKVGKALDQRNTQVNIQFKNDGLHLFPGAPCDELVIRLQPKEAIWLKLNTKQPGFARFDRALQHELELTYNERFVGLYLPEAYTRLIADCLRGDQSLFVREDELRESWRILTPVLQELEDKQIDPQKYPRGSRGPSQADEMAFEYGFSREQAYEWPKRSLPDVQL